MLPPQPHVAWDPETGEAEGGQNRLQPCWPKGGHLFFMLRVVSSPLGALIWNRAPSGHVEVNSAKLEYTSSMVAQKRYTEAKDDWSVHPSSPEQETPFLALRTPGVILL